MLTLNFNVALLAIEPLCKALHNCSNGPAAGPCWVHIRRKFIEAESGDPCFKDWVLRQTRYLFMVEKVAWSCSEEEHFRIRQEKEIPIIDRLITAIKDKLINGKILPKSKFKEALGYFCGLIPLLKNYTEHAWARLDNNVAE